MAPPPLATANDLASWVGQDISPTDPRAEAVLSAASALVRAHTGQTWVDEDTPDVVAAIVVQVAARVWLNPAGLTSVTVDDSTRRWGEAGTAGLYLTDAEKDTLADYSASGRPADVGVLSMTRGPLGLSTVYVPTEPAGPPFPWYSTEDFA